MFFVLFNYQDKISEMHERC